MCLGTDMVPTRALRRGTKIPKCWGVLAAALKSSAAWGSSMQPRPAVQKGVVLAGRVLGVAPWGPSLRRGPLHANSHAGRAGTTYRGVVGALSCADTTAYPAGKRKEIFKYTLLVRDFVITQTCALETPYVMVKLPSHAHFRT